MKLLLLLFALTTAAAAQEPCGLRTMTESAAPIYPPIARAAHIQGNVIMLVSFKTTGEVGRIAVLSGPQILQPPALDYVKAWHANEFTGPRTCPIVIRFALNDPDVTEASIRLDLQHVAVHGQAPCLCDPSGTLGKRKRRFLIF